MDTDNLLHDDFLASLIRKAPLESPSDEFVGKVMESIEPLAPPLYEKQPYFLWLKSYVPYFGLGALIVLILYSSDIPYFNFLSARDHFSDMFIHVFRPFIASLKTLVSSRLISYSLLIGVSAGFLFLIDSLFSRRFSS